LEIIHDFFLQEWPGVAERFDPQRGTLEAFSTYAFVRFARRRLAQEARLERVLASAAFVAEQAEPNGELDTASLDTPRIGEALGRLQPGDRLLLELRFGTPPYSERQIAEYLKTTRYAARSSLASALARLIALVGHSTQLDTTDIQIAKAFFVDQEASSSVAERFSITESQANKARARILRTISKLLGGRQ